MEIKSKSICCNCKKAKVKLYRLKKFRNRYTNIPNHMSMKHKVRCLAGQWKTFSGNEQLKTIVGVRFAIPGNCKHYVSMGDSINRYMLSLPTTTTEYEERWLYSSPTFRREHVQ